MATPSIQTLITQAQQVLNLQSSNEIRATLAAVLANANVGTPLNPNLTTQQLWNEFGEIVRQSTDDIMSIVVDQMMRMVFSPPAPGGAGADKQVIFNDGGVLAGDAGLTYNKATDLLTAGSATITGALTVDTTTLVVNAAGYADRVGIGQATPATTLDVNGDITQRNGSGTIIGNIMNSSGLYDVKASANVTGLQLSTAAATPIVFAVNNVEAMRLNSSGNLAFVNGKGIDFSAVTGGTGTATANVLNDYEEGIWDASFGTGTGTVTISTAANRCKYTKIGRLVTVHGFLQVTSVSSPTGPLLISGLPFAIPSTTEGDAYSAVSVFPDNLEITATGQIAGFGLPSSTSIYLYRYQAGVSVGLAPSMKAGSEITFTFTYSV